MSEFQHCRC